MQEWMIENEPDSDHLHDDSAVAQGETNGCNVGG